MKPPTPSGKDANLMTDVIRPFAGGIRLSVRARAGAVGGRMRPPQLVPLADGGRALELSVTAAPEGGKANKALMEALARGLGCAKGAVTLKAGQTGKLKVFEVAGPPEVLLPKAIEWLASLSK